MSNTTKPRWCLSSPAYGHAPEKVDRDKGVIYGVAVVTEGEAQGHDVMLDSEFVEDVIDAGNARRSGLKVRFGHPNMSSTALGTFLGRAKSFRRSDRGGKAVALADVYLSNEAKDTPHGNLYDYVLGMAQNESDMFGMSIVFTPGEEYQKAGPDGTVDKGSPLYASLEKLHAVDMVDDPAANPDGLFSAWSMTTFAGQVTEFLDTHPELFRLVEANPDVINQFMSRYRAYLQRRGINMDNDTELEAGQTAQPETDAIAESSEQQADASEDTEETSTQHSESGEGNTEQRDDALSESTEPSTSDPRAELKRFMEAFGDPGAHYYADGLTFEQAQGKHIETLKAENDSLKARLAALPRGETEPVAFQAEQTPVDAEKARVRALETKLATKLPENIAKVAANIKFAK